MDSNIKFIFNRFLIWKTFMEFQSNGCNVVFRVHQCPHFLIKTKHKTEDLDYIIKKFGSCFHTNKYIGKTPT